MTYGVDLETARILQLLRRSENDLGDARARADALQQELEETNRGLVALYAELDEARVAAEQLAVARALREVVAERDRMARDLNDRAIQRIYAAGIALEAAAALAEHPAAQERIRGVVGELDESITAIRRAIFAIREGEDERPGLPALVLGTLSQATQALGFSPSVTFEGPLQDVPETVAEHVLAALREALFSVAMHARASSVAVTLGAGAELVLRVIANGRGLSGIARSSGWLSMRQRAQALGGSFRIASKADGWAELRWQVPLAAAAQAR